MNEGIPRWRVDWEVGLRLYGAVDIALCLVIAYLHGMDIGVDSGAFKSASKPLLK
jgi:hypothetical protein